MDQKKYLVIIIFLILVLSATLTLIFRTVVFSGKAVTVNQSPVALDNSYLFASPLQAKADGKEQIRITAFILDGRGLGIPGQTVTLSLPQTVTVLSPLPATDDTGKIIFDLSSPAAAKIDVQAKVGAGTLPQKVKIVFY